MKKLPLILLLAAAIGVAIVFIIINLRQDEYLQKAKDMIELCQQAIDIDPNNATAYNDMG
jgi:hypothetical protein